jgi:hypothetical protein
MLESALFPRKLASNFMLDPGPNSVLELEPKSECISVLIPVPPRQKVAVPAIPVLAPVPQHWLDHSLSSFAFFFTSVVQSVWCDTISSV